MFEHRSSGHEFMKGGMREKAELLSFEISSLLSAEDKDFDLLKQKVADLKVVMGFVSEEKAIEYRGLIEKVESSF